MGLAMGRLAADAGWQVAYYDAHSNEEISRNIRAVGDDVREMSFADLCASSTVVVLSLPFSESADIDYRLLSDTIVVDPMNYWAPTDGDLPELADFDGSTTELVIRRNPRMRVVKTLNHQACVDLTTDPRSASAPSRRALAVCSDDIPAREIVAELVDDMGFDPVQAGLDRAKLLEMGGPIFGVYLNRDQLADILA